jgi:hypothetical protein
MQRDIGDQRFWDLADRIPVIIPPVLNKDSHLSGKYLSRAIELLRDQAAVADRVISLGFSVPPSDRHVAEALKSIRAGTRVGLVFRMISGDSTLKNWEGICPKDHVEVPGSAGIPLSSQAEIDSFWQGMLDFVEN